MHTWDSWIGIDRVCNTIGPRVTAVLSLARDLDVYVVT